VLGQRPSTVGELVEAGVEALDVEQALLVGGGGFQVGLLAGWAAGGATVRR
jgi:hypothetical protein